MSKHISVFRAGAVVAAAIVSLVGGTAMAGHHGSYGSYGSHGSYGSYGSHGSWGGGYGGGWGHGHYGGGYYGGGYYSGGSSGGWYSGGSSGGSSGGYAYGGGGYGGGYSTPEYYQGAPVQQQQVAPKADDADLPELPGAARRTGDAKLLVNVPAGAKIFVNDRATSSTGSSREYISRGLRNGYRYRYEVRAEAVVDGQTVQQTRSISLRAGEAANVDFDFSQPAEVAEEKSEPVQTKLTLHVPADAKVILAGRETSAAGETRTFATTKIAKGQEWPAYTVKVQVERDGEMLEKVETIALVGGESREVTIRFDEAVAGIAANTR